MLPLPFESPQGLLWRTPIGAAPGRVHRLDVLEVLFRCGEDGPSGRRLRALDRVVLVLPQIGRPYENVSVRVPGGQVLLGARYLCGVPLSLEVRRRSGPTYENSSQAKSARSQD